MTGSCAAIVDILSRMMDLIDPPASPEPPRKQIGFEAEEERAEYGTVSAPSYSP